MCVEQLLDRHSLPARQLAQPIPRLIRVNSARRSDAEELWLRGIMLRRDRPYVKKQLSGSPKRVVPRGLNCEEREIGLVNDGKLAGKLKHGCVERD